MENFVYCIQIIVLNRTFQEKAVKDLLQEALRELKTWMPNEDDYDNSTF
jgi:hypothetical protein